MNKLKDAQTRRRDERCLEGEQEEGGKERRKGAYHVMTFSLTGLALTPAGGSDCILYMLEVIR
jgi:hypothetical protein